MKEKRDYYSFILYCSPILQLKILRLKGVKSPIQVHMASRSEDKTRERGSRACVLPWPDVASSSHCLNEVWLPCLSSLLDSEQLEAKGLFLGHLSSPIAYPGPGTGQKHESCEKPWWTKELLSFILRTSAHWPTPHSKFPKQWIPLGGRFKFYVWNSFYYYV